MLIIRQWNTKDPAGSWKNRKWAPAGVEACVVYRLLELGAKQSSLDPNVFSWQKVVSKGAR